MESNKEKGLGRPDILLRDKRNRRAIIIEAKKSRRESDMEKDCEEAIGQMIREQLQRGFMVIHRFSAMGFRFFRSRQR